MSTEQIVTIVIAVLGLVTAIVKHWEALKKGKGLEAVTDAIEQLKAEDVHRTLEEEDVALVIDTLKRKIQQKAVENGGEKALNKEVRKAERRDLWNELTP